MRITVRPCPGPRSALTAWLLSTPHPVPHEAVGELRGSMFRRMESLVASAAAGTAIMGIAAFRHPDPSFAILLALDVTLLVLRVALVVILTRRLARPVSDRTSATWLVDLFVAAGTTWCGLIGLSAGLCMATGDASLGLLAAIFATSTTSALCARNPGTPRLTVLQIALIMTPFALGALNSVEPLLALVAMLAPPYVLSMMSINRQLHADYVELVVARFETRRRALHCPLTGLPNRSFFDESLKAALDRAGADGRSVCVLALDLDGFKGVNDAFGHPVGDRLLRQVADRIRGVSGSAAFPARLGGDEFAMLLPSEDTGAAEATARALIETVGRPYVLDGAGTVTIGVSIGVAICDEAEALVAQADAALYAAKRAGRGTFRWHWAEDVIAARSLREIAKRMRAA